MKDIQEVERTLYGQYFISHMVQMKDIISKLYNINKIYFISHMVQMKDRH